MSNISVGKQGEQLACEYLKKQGYKILETNKHFSKFCEADIIALDKNTLVFCEVKTRTTTICGSPFEAITSKKYKNMKTAIFMYLKDNPKYKKYRLDAISIVLKPTLDIQHLKNI